MTMKPKVYLETTIVSYLTARPSRDLIIAGHQQITQEWWDSQRDNYELFISQPVLTEAGMGEPLMAQSRLAVLNSLNLLATTGEALALAKKLIAPGPLPIKAATDALHIALAAHHGLDYLLTWNCKHIANAQMWPRINVLCLMQGYQPPTICTPEELSGV